MTDSRRDPAVVSMVMRKVRSNDTGPELRLRRELHRRGLRYRLHDQRLPGKPDLVFARARLVVFVDGDFWHGRKWETRGLPTLESQFHHNKDYWIRKITRNMARDGEVNQALSNLGWKVLRIWESDILRDLLACVARVEAGVKGTAANERTLRLDSVAENRDSYSL